MVKKPIILAIESSCDETSAAIICNGKIANNIVATQSVHENYGGVVPELASRAHEKHIVPIVDEALRSAEVSKSDLDAVAFTQGPGLLGALLVGTSFAKALAFLSCELDQTNAEVLHKQCRCAILKSRMKRPRILS